MAPSVDLFGQDDDETPLPEDDKQLIKDNLLEMMCTSPPAVQRMVRVVLSGGPSLCGGFSDRSA